MVPTTSRQENQTSEIKSCKSDSVNTGVFISSSSFNTFCILSSSSNTNLYKSFATYNAISNTCQTSVTSPATGTSTTACQADIVIVHGANIDGAGTYNITYSEYIKERINELKDSTTYIEISQKYKYDLNETIIEDLKNKFNDVTNNVLKKVNEFFSLCFSFFTKLYFKIITEV